jgi:hypothetical protein
MHLRDSKAQKRTVSWAWPLMVEESLSPRGIIVSHDSVRQWPFKFGREFANRIRRSSCRCLHHLPRPSPRLTNLQHFPLNGWGTIHV